MTEFTFRNEFELKLYIKKNSTAANNTIISGKVEKKQCVGFVT